MFEKVIKAVFSASYWLILKCTRRICIKRELLVDYTDGSQEVSVASCKRIDFIWHGDLVIGTVYMKHGDNKCVPNKGRKIVDMLGFLQSNFRGWILFSSYVFVIIPFYVALC